MGTAHPHTKRHIPKEPYLHLHHCQVLKSLKSQYVYFTVINFGYQALKLTLLISTLIQLRYQIQGTNEADLQAKRNYI